MFKPYLQNNIQWLELQGFPALNCWDTLQFKAVPKLLIYPAAFWNNILMVS